MFYGSKALHESKNFENRTTFRYAYLPSKFYYIAPLMNYSQYSLERSKILVSGLGKKLKNNFEVQVHMSVVEMKKKKSGVTPRGSGRP